MGEGSVNSQFAFEIKHFPPWPNHISTMHNSDASSQCRRSCFKVSFHPDSHFPSWKCECETHKLESRKFLTRPANIFLPLSHIPRRGEREPNQFHPKMIQLDRNRKTIQPELGMKSISLNNSNFPAPTTSLSASRLAEMR